MRLNIKIDLKKLANASLVNLKGKTATKRCLVIPVDDANLFVGERGIYLDLTAYPYNDKNGNPKHLVKQSFSKEVFHSFTEDEIKALPILGDIEPWIPKEMAAQSDMQIDESNTPDDIPF